MNRREFLASLPAVAAAQRRQQPTNVILIVVDDWGWTDLGCYGSRYYRTPNIDRLASQGIRFTQAYSACTVCSPSRAAILTGKYPARLHITDWIPGHQRPDAKLRPPDWTQHLPLDEVTIAEALKPVGYATAHIGKWHLGGPEFYPDHQGFDCNIGGTHRGQPPSYFSPYRIPTLEDGPEGEYLTDREAAEAIRFIRQNRSKPFFIYLPHYAVHTPLQAKKDMIEKYRRLAEAGDSQGSPIYAAMIESMDESVGRVLAMLDELGLADRTAVILTSDNGGLERRTSNAPLRAGKGTAYEGGVRVPFIVRWPGVTKAGSTCHVPVIGMDVYPTVLEIAGVKPPKAIDGLSIVPLLQGATRIGRDVLYWHYPHYHSMGATPYGAVREGDLRYIEWQEDGHFELYDLKSDIGERQNLADSRPTDVKRLAKRLADWRQQVGAQMALPNPAAR
jgi:arylsulfatase A-like enzyme